MMPGNQPTPPPAFASNPQGQKPKSKSQNTTFIGAAGTPPSNPTWGKSLLGQ